MVATVWGYSTLVALALSLFGAAGVCIARQLRHRSMEGLGIFALLSLVITVFCVALAQAPSAS